MGPNAIDSHCHLQLAAYDNDREAVIKRCRESGIGLVIVGTNYETSSAAVRLAEACGENAWASIAVHPGHLHAPHHDEWEVAAPPQEEFFNDEFFSSLASSPKVVAVGETGLDYYRLTDSPSFPLASIKKQQQENFLAHISFAKKRDLPLIMHVRDDGGGEAYGDALEILAREYGGKPRGVMHCFGGSLADAEKCLNMGLFLGIGGIITFPPRKGQAENPLVAVVQKTSLDKILIETDAPYISPLRGQRNEPINVLKVAEKIAEIKGETVKNVLQTTRDNAIRLFNLA
jgi:TatD DNase family protein